MLTCALTIFTPLLVIPIVHTILLLLIIPPYSHHAPPSHHPPYSHHTPPFHHAPIIPIQSPISPLLLHRVYDFMYL